MTTSTVVPIVVTTLSASPYVSVLTVTGGGGSGSGSVQTILVTPTVMSSSPFFPQPTVESTTQQVTNNSFWSNKGAVAGVFTVVGLLIFISLLILGFFIYRRHNRNSGQKLIDKSDVGEEENMRLNTRSNTNRSSAILMGGPAMRGLSGYSNEKSPHMSPNIMSRHASQPLTDQRLNPMALAHINGSRVSVGSLRDDRDYSRPVLQVRNPDFDDK